MRIPAILVSLLIIAASNSAAWTQETLQWEQSLDVALNKARELNRPVLLEFTAPWCGVCRTMHRDVLSQPAVEARIASSFVPARVNVDHYPNLGKQFGITGLPTIAVVSPDGRCLEMHRGALTAEQLFAKIGRYEPNRQYAARPTGERPVGGPAENRYAANQRPVGPSADPLGMPAGPSTAEHESRYANLYEGPYQRHVEQPIPGPQGPEQGSDRAPAMPVNGRPFDMATGSPSSAVTPSQSMPYGGNSMPPEDAYRQMNPHQPESPNPASRYEQANVPGPSARGTEGQPVAAPYAPPASQPGVEPQHAASGLNPEAPVAGAAPSEFAMDGFCPVTLVESRAWQKGDRRFGARHEGRVYLFTGPGEQQRFLANPGRYSPVFAGMDVVAMVERGEHLAGSREHGLFFGDRIYLFSSEESLQKFTNKPHHYTASLSQGLGRKADLPPRTTYR